MFHMVWSMEITASRRLSLTVIDTLVFSVDLVGIRKGRPVKLTILGPPDPSVCGFLVIHVIIFHDLLLRNTL